MNSTTGARAAITARAHEMCSTLAHVLRSLQETVRCTPTVEQMPLQEPVRCTPPGAGAAIAAGTG